MQLEEGRPELALALQHELVEPREAKPVVGQPDEVEPLQDAEAPMRRCCSALLAIPRRASAAAAATLHG